jgi:hypothetical protein
MRTTSRALDTGGVLLILLALARGAGGMVLLARGGAAVEATGVASRTAALLGAGLLVVAAAAFAAGAAVLRRHRWGWRLGITAAIAFVLDGVLNGFVLFGHPGAGGTAGNALAAGVILACLWAGRGALAPAAGPSSLAGRGE